MTENRGYSRSAYEREQIDKCILSLAEKSAFGITMMSVTRYINKNSRLCVNHKTVLRHLKSLTTKGKLVCRATPSGGGQKYTFSLPDRVHAMNAFADAMQKRDPLSRAVYKTRSTNLLLNLKRIYFDQIATGEKTEEYREIIPFNTSRVTNPGLKTIELQLGYPAHSDTDRIMIFPWNGYEVKTIQHNEFGATPVKVYAIPLRGRIQ